MADARVFQETAEAAVTGQITAAQVFQEQVNVAVAGQTTDARVAQMVVEVGVPYVGLDPAVVQPTGITSAQGVGTPTVVQEEPPTGHTMLPLGINSAQAVGEPLVTARIDPDPIFSQEAVGEPLVTARIDPDPVPSHEAFGVPLILGTIAPDPIVSREVIGQVAVFVEATLSWHSVTGTTAGELFRAAYTLTHPATVTATLTLADGRVLALTGDPLEVLLPPDTPTGVATITAEVDGETYTLGVPLTGTIIAPEEGPRPSPPAGPRARRPRPRTGPERVTKRVASRWDVGWETRVYSTARAQAELGWTSSASVRPRTPIRTFTTVELRSRAHSPSSVHAAKVVIPTPATRLQVRRRDGRATEDLLLGLLD